MDIKSKRQSATDRHWLTLVAAALLSAGVAFPAWSEDGKALLKGDQDIPPVTTSASGTGTFQVAADRSVRGSVSINGMTPTAVHIHEAPAGKAGPIIIPLVQTANGVWSIPEAAKLTAAQYESYRAGALYYNVHSAAYKGGEIRGQIKP